MVCGCRRAHTIKTTPAIIGADAGDLGVAHAEINLRIDADKLDQKAGQAGPNEILAGNHTNRPVDLSALPQIPGDQQGGNELIDRRGLNALHGGNQAMWKLTPQGKEVGMP